MLFSSLIGLKTTSLVELVPFKMINKNSSSVGPSSTSLVELVPFKTINKNSSSVSPSSTSLVELVPTINNNSSSVGPSSTSLVELVPTINNNSSSVGPSSTPLVELFSLIKPKSIYAISCLIVLMSFLQLLLCQPVSSVYFPERLTCYECKTEYPGDLCSVLTRLTPRRTGMKQRCFNNEPGTLIHYCRTYSWYRNQGPPYMYRELLILCHPGRDGECGNRNNCQLCQTDLCNRGIYDTKFFRDQDDRYHINGTITTKKTETLLVLDLRPIKIIGRNLVDTLHNACERFLKWFTTGGDNNT
ncbi:hypothetical protein WDU94_002939 [Cyamophila willieti]